MLYVKELATRDSVRTALAKKNVKTMTKVLIRPHPTFWSECFKIARYFLLNVCPVNCGHKIELLVDNLELSGGKKTSIACKLCMGKGNVDGYTDCMPVMRG